jgi:hypothetical protein
VQLELLANASWTAIGLLALIAYFVFGYRSLATDSFYERLSEVQDRMRAYFSSRGLTKVPAYRRLDASIEATLDHAKNLTLARFVAFNFVARRETATSHAEPCIHQLIAAIEDEDAQRQINATLSEFEIAVVRHLFIGSFVGLFAAAFLYPAFLISQGFGRLRHLDRSMRALLQRRAPGFLHRVEDGLGARGGACAC